jgi:hypothetical protein
MVGPPDEQPEIVLKLAHNSEGVASLRRQREVQAVLHEDPRLHDWRILIPRPIAQGEIRGGFYVVEQGMAGRSALSQLGDADHRARIQTEAAATISGLHRRTAARVVVDARMLNRWVDAPLGLIRCVGVYSDPARYRGAIERLRRELYETVEGRTVTVGWIHGDYWLGNLLLTGDGATPVGIVDWDRAAPAELGWHDVFHLIVQTRKYLNGDRVVDMARILSGDDAWTREERSILNQARMAMPDDAIPDRTIGLLYWLRHTAGTLELYPHNARSDEYVSLNVERVLQNV